MTNYSSQLNGLLEDIEITKISSSSQPLRCTLNKIDELAKSINKIGLLQPIVVRMNSLNNLEVVAGNRRLKACKILGLGKVACHLVELDDKQAFEASIVENVQRKTLSPIEEGLAYRKYIDEFGWGGVSELAKKLSKSNSYICKRIRLTELPKNIINLISKSEISVSTGEELLPIVDKNNQSRISQIIRKRKLSSRMVRKLVKQIENKNIGEDLYDHFTDMGEYDKICKMFDKVILSVKLLIEKLVIIIESVEDKWIFYDILMQHKQRLHEQVDILLKEKRRYKKYSHILSRYF